MALTLPGRDSPAKEPTNDAPKHRERLNHALVGDVPECASRHCSTPGELEPMSLGGKGKINRLSRGSREEGGWRFERTPSAARIPILCRKPTTELRAGTAVS